MSDNQVEPSDEQALRAARAARLRRVPVFGNLPDDLLDQLAEAVHLKHHVQGETIFHEGDHGDAMYLVETGQVEVISEHTGRVLAYMGPGSFVGETALLLGQPRSATLRVVLDAELWELHKDDLDQLLTDHPALALELTREIERRLVRTSKQTDAPHKTPITAIRATFVWDIAKTLATQLDGRVGVVMLPENQAHTSEADHAVRAPEGLPDAVQAIAHPAGSLTAEVSRQLARVDHLLLVLPDERTPDALKRIGLCDVAASVGRPPVWLANAIGDKPMMVGRGSTWGIESLSRRISGRCVALVLSSGGGKTAAHLGVIKALRDAKIPIDMIAGTSGGSLFGAMIAAEWSNEKMLEFATNLHQFNRFRNWDLNLPPRTGIVKGKKVRRLFDQWFEGLHFEDLRIPFYVVATDLALGKEVVFNTGPLADAIRASSSIPGLATPWFCDGRYHVDGAVVNPLPASVARQYGANIVIGSSVVRTSGDPRGQQFARTPNMLQAMFRMMGAVESEVVKRQLPLIDVLIHPQVVVDHSLDFTRAGELIAEGERVANNKMADIRKALRPKKSQAPHFPSASIAPKVASVSPTPASPAAPAPLSSPATAPRVSVDPQQWLDTQAPRTESADRE